LGVFEEGTLIHAAVFPVGSSHITNDIAICLKTDIDTAEKIKLEFATCKDLSKKEKKGEKRVKLEGEETLSFSISLLSDIVEARVSEILDLTNKELKKIARQEMLPAGVVLTGGGVKLPGIKNLTKKRLKLPCRIGTAKGFFGFHADPSLSTLCGLILEGIDLEEEQKKYSSPGRGIINRLKNIFRVFIP